jgi:hypothetical protein
MIILPDGAQVDTSAWAEEAGAAFVRAYCIVDGKISPERVAEMSEFLGIRLDKPNENTGA